MGSIIDTAVSTFRDFETDGVPASGGHKPAKAEIRGLFSLVESSIGTATLGSVSVAKATRAALDADLAHVADTVALVYADAAEANNDLYIKTGGSGAGAWTLTNALHDAIEALAGPYTDAAEAAAAQVVALSEQMAERDRWNVDPRLRQSAGTGDAQQIAVSDPVVVTGGVGGAAPAISGAGVTVYPRDSDLVRRLGGRWELGTGFPGGLMIYQRNNTYNAGPRAGSNPTFEVVLSGDSFEFFVLGTGGASTWAVEVDGVFSNAAGYARPANDGNGYYYRLTFGSVAVRRVRVHLPVDMPVGEIRVPSGQTLLDPAPVLNTTAVFVGDSITEGAVATQPRLRWAEQCAARLGIDDYVIAGVGSSGYLQTNAGAVYNFNQRVADVLQAFDGGPPDALVVAGGINDSTLAAADVGAAALAYFQALRAGAPHMPIFVLGPFWGDGAYPTVTPNLPALRDAIFAAAAQVPRVFTFDIEDWYTDPARSTWFAGSTNGPHPIDAGHTAYGAMAADLIKPVMLSL